MPENFRFNATIEGRYEAADAFRAASLDARELGTQLDRLDGRTINLDARLDGTTETLSELKALDQYADRLDGRDIDMNVDVDTGGAVAELAAFETASTGADVASRSLEDSVGSLGGQIRQSAGTMRAVGLGAIIAGIAGAAYLAGPGIQALGGGLVAIGGAATSAGAGVGLLAAAIIPSIGHFSRYNSEVQAAHSTLKTAEKGTDAYRQAQERLSDASKILTGREKDLLTSWQNLSDAFSNDKGFSRANDTLLDLGSDVLRLANRVMPALGKEADETATSFSQSARIIAKEWGSHEQNSVGRILDNASDTIGDITRSLGRGGQGLANLIGSPAAVRGARDFSGYLEDITRDFRDWSRTEKARDGIADWLDRAKTVGRGVRDAFSDIADAIGRFGDKDAQNAADALRGIGKATSFMIDELRKTGRAGGDFIDWLGDAGDAIDKFDGKLKDSRKDQKGWWDDLGSGISGPNAVGRKLESWIEHLGDKSLKDLGKSFDGNSKDVKSWSDAQAQATKRTEDQWNTHIAQKVFGWLTDFGKNLADNQTELESWARKHGAKTSETEHNWKQAILDGVVDAVFPNLSRALGDSATETDTWADRVKSILGSIMDFLGIEHGDSGKGGHIAGSGNPHSGAGDPAQSPGSYHVPGQRGRYEGGIYQGSVRMMASGGISSAFVDSSGVYTAITTGMDRALSRGAVWQAASGGISDGLAPRVVYGEGHPGEGPQEEGFLPKNLARDKAIPILSTMADWFNMGLVPLMASGGVLPPRGAMAGFGADKILQYTATAGAEAVAREGAKMWRGLVQPGGRENIVSISNLGGNLRGLSYADGRTYLDPLARPPAAAHEFGHHLGLGHGGHSIMGGAGYVTPEDFAALRQYYGVVPPGGSSAGGGSGGSGGYSGGSWDPRGGSGNVNITNIHMTGSGAGGSVHTSSSQGGGTAHGAHAPDYPSMMRWMMRNPTAGMIKRMTSMPRFMQSGGIYTVSPSNLYPEAWNVASDIASTFNYLNEPGTTYAGHGADGDARNSIDFEVSPWGTVAQGAQFQTGEAIKNRLQSKWAGMTDYIIWNKMANYGSGWEPYRGGGGYAPPSDPSSYHQDHVHEEVLTGPGSGISGTGGSGNGGFDAMGYVLGKLGQIVAPALGLGPYGAKLAPAMVSYVKDNATEFFRNWIAEHGFGIFASGGGGSVDAAGGLAEWAKNGLMYGNIFEPSASNIQKIITLANKESGGDPRAHNPSGASGLMQMMPSTFSAYEVSGSDSIWNPVHNVAASSRYQKDRYGNLITFSPYTAGGIALQPQFASVAERGPEFFMPLDQPESARRFLNLLEGLHSDRVTRQHRMPDIGEPDVVHSRAPSNAALIKEIRLMREQLKSVGIDPDSQRGIGDAAAGGTLDRASKDRGAQKKIHEGQKSYTGMRDDLSGKRS